MRIFAMFFVALFAVAWMRGADAHDAIGLAHRSMAISKDTTLNGVARLQPPDERTRSVLVNLNKWPYKSLTACFYDGSAAIRARIVSAARAWLSDEVRLEVDFGAAPGFRTCSPTPNAEGRFEDVRIGFRDSGYWSYIGIDAHRIDGPTMNLQEFDRLPPDEPDFSRIVKHEFGHAFGFHHEHQSPGVNCEPEFNIDRIKRDFGWSDEDIKTNILVLERNSKMYTWSRYDPESIMMYSLDESLLWKGRNSRCYVSQNDDLSSQDMRAIKAAYPAVRAPSSVSRDMQGLSAMSLPDAVGELVRLRQRLSGADR